MTHARGEDKTNRNVEKKGDVVRTTYTEQWRSDAFNIGQRKWLITHFIYLILPIYPAMHGWCSAVDIQQSLTAHPRQERLSKIISRQSVVISFLSPIDFK